MTTDRRAFLRGVGVFAVAAATAGCTGDDTDAGAETTAGSTSTAEATPSPTPEPTPSPTPQSTPAGGATDVAVGPEGRLRFVPDLVEVAVGDTVRWVFESPGHNVSSLPSADARCSNPEGAEPFASYEDEQHYAVLPVGEVFEHTFSVPGEYVYVCVPHAGQGMIGTVRVAE